MRSSNTGFLQIRNIANTQFLEQGNTLENDVELRTVETEGFLHVLNMTVESKTHGIRLTFFIVVSTVVDSTVLPQLDDCRLTVA